MHFCLVHREVNRIGKVWNQEAKLCSSSTSQFCCGATRLGGSQNIFRPLLVTGRGGRAIEEVIYASDNRVHTALGRGGVWVGVGFGLFHPPPRRGAKQLLAIASSSASARNTNQQIGTEGGVTGARTSRSWPEGPPTERKRAWLSHLLYCFDH